jgi:thiol-disulfide isomerase/thioredoxin
VNSRLRSRDIATAFAFVAALACIAAGPARAIEANVLLPWKGGATPKLALAALDGRRVDLKALRGKTVIVNFWATWCGPCREEMPSLAALAKAEGTGVVVLAVNVGESRPKVQQFLAAHSLDLDVLLDAQGEAAADWRIAIYPSSFVISPDGRIHSYIAGALDWNDPAVVRRLPATGVAHR